VGWDLAATADRHGDAHRHADGAPTTTSSPTPTSTPTATATRRAQTATELPPAATEGAADDARDAAHCTEESNGC
jgi:hypothetical protein